MKKKILSLAFGAGLLFSNGCSIITAPYHAAKGAVQGSIWVVKTTCEVTAGTVKTIYKIGKYTYEVVKAPAGSALTHDEIESMDGLP